MKKIFNMPEEETIDVLDLILESVRLVHPPIH